MRSDGDSMMVFVFAAIAVLYVYFSSGAFL